MTEGDKLAPDVAEDAKTAVRFALGDDAREEDVAAMAALLHRPAELMSDEQLGAAQRFAELEARRRYGNYPETNTNSSETELAKDIARRAHDGQQDKAGRDYFEAHLVPIACAATVFGETVTAAAWLHDVLEDTNVTADELRRLSVSPPVVSAVESVTRRANESYTQLIERAGADPVGRFVKLIDNAWNITSNPVLAVTDPERARSLLHGRYEPARRQLMTACALEENGPMIREVHAILNAFHQNLAR